MGPRASDIIFCKIVKQALKPPIAVDCIYLRLLGLMQLLHYVSPQTITVNISSLARTQVGRLNSDVLRKMSFIRPY